MSIENDPRSTAVPVFPADVWILISRHAEIPDFFNLRATCYALYSNERISQEFKRRQREQWVQWFENNENPFDEGRFPHHNKIWNYCAQIAKESPGEKDALAKIFHHIASGETIPDENENWNPELTLAINGCITQDNKEFPLTPSEGVNILVDSLSLLNRNTAPHYPVKHIERREVNLSCAKILARVAGFGIGGFITFSGILARTLSPPSDIFYGNILLTVGSVLVGSGAVIEVAGNHRFRNWCRARIFQPTPHVVDEESPLIPENDNGNRL